MQTAPPPVMSKNQAHEALTAPGAPFEMEPRVIGGIPLRVWKNAPPTLRDVFLAGETYPDREFIVSEDERITFAVFGRAARAIAARLSADGVVKGDRVAVVMRNLPEWPAAFYAASMVGAIVAPLNAWWTGRELEYALADCGAKAVFADAERWERIKDHAAALPDLKNVYVCRGAAAGTTALEDVIGPVAAWADLPDNPMPDGPLAPDDDATIFYTSGTTGKPKGALASHRALCCNIFSSAFVQARMFLMAGLPLGATNPHDRPQRVTLMTIPMFHVTGFCAILNPSVATGGKLVLMPRWEPEQAMRLIEDERVTVTGGVPTIAWQLIEHPARANYDLSSLELITYGGAPSAPDLVRKIGADLKTAPGNGWGMTETCAVFTQHFGPEYAARPDSCGPAVPVGDLKIMDPDGLTEVEIGAVGEVWAKGPQVVKGYWNNPAATAETFRDGWMRSGDLGRMDAEGYLYIVDRAKDMLIRGGENIYCVEVENALYEHPAIIDAALIGLPSMVMGEEPAAVVTLKAGMTTTQAELQAFVRERLAGFKVPSRIVFLHEPLPRNANGKILKGELKALFEP